MGKKILLAVTLLAIVAGLVATARVKSAGRNWQQHLAALRKAGEPLSFAEIEARQSKPSHDGQTVAQVLERVAETVKNTPGPISRGVLGMDVERRIDFFTGIPTEAVQKTREYLTPRRVALKGLGEISGLEPGRFSIPHGRAPMEMMARFSEAGPSVARVSRLLYIDAAIKLIDGDLEGATATIPLQLQLVEPLAEEPELMAHLFQIEGAATAIRTLENILRVGALDEGTLREIDARFARFLALHTIKWTLWGERASLISFPEQMRSTLGFRGTILSLVTAADQRRGVQMLGWLIEAGDDPEKLLSAARKIEAELPTLSNRHVLTSANLTPLPPTVISHVRCLAEIRAAHVALAAERHRLAKGHLPGSLDELVPEFIEAIPVDPFDGHRMKFAVRHDGIVIYSTDQDATDDGGGVEPRTGEKRPRDRGFRLLEAEERRLVFLDAPSTE